MVLASVALFCATEMGGVWTTLLTPSHQCRKIFQKGNLFISFGDFVKKRVSATYVNCDRVFFLKRKGLGFSEALGFGHLGCCDLQQSKCK